MKKFAVIIALVIITLFPGCHISDQILAQKMLEKYSDNESYVTLSGKIIELNENNNILISCKELSKHLSYQSELCAYHIYSNQIIELSVGDQIDFVTVPFHFYNGQKLPIVELKTDGNILLTFEEGKENLIEWVNTTFI